MHTIENLGGATRPHIVRAILVLLTFSFAAQAHAQRAIPDDNLAYPVLITVKREQKPLGMASGFYLATDRGLYLVTAGHVLRNVLTPDPETQKIPNSELELLSYSKDVPVAKRISITLSLPALKDSGAVKVHPSQDVAVVRLTSASGDGKKSNFLPGVTAKENAEGAALGVAVATVKTFDQVLVGNDAIMFGYPVSLGLEQFPQFESDRPLLRKALVAGQNNQKRTIIIDSPSYPGNSGGPVFQIERSGAVTYFSLIGIVVSHIPLVRSAINPTADVAFMVAFNSGYTVVEPMDFVLELINQEVADTGPAPRVAEIVPVRPLEPRTAATASQLNGAQAGRKTPAAQKKTPSSAQLTSKPRRHLRDERPHRRDISRL